MMTLKVYPRGNVLDAEIEYEETTDFTPCMLIVNKWFGLIRNLFINHSWRVVERWVFPFSDGPFDTTSICTQCGALKRFFCSKDQEGEVTSWTRRIIGTVLPKWRDYDPYEFKVVDEP